MPFWLPFLISIGIQILGYLIMPKPKREQPGMAKDMESPVAEAGMTIPKVWGTVTVKGLNILWSGDKKTRKYKVKS